MTIWALLYGGLHMSNSNTTRASNLRMLTWLSVNSYLAIINLIINKNLINYTKSVTTSDTC